MVTVTKQSAVELSFNRILLPLSVMNFKPFLNIFNLVVISPVPILVRLAS